MTQNAFEHMATKPVVNDVSWVSEAESPSGIRVLDVRPITLTMLSTSRDPDCAANAVSFESDDGTCFIGESPPVDRVVKANLRFPIAQFLADGVIFMPLAMEHKWAIFYHLGVLICVRSWLRRVRVVAHVEVHECAIELSEIRGVFVSEAEEPEFTVSFLDCLLRTHALNSVYPAPLPPGMELDPQAAAYWCFSMFGNQVSFATPDRFDRTAPSRPLRSLSLLHFAAARGDLAMLERSLAAGVPIDLLGSDGWSPLHRALDANAYATVSVLLAHGASVDVRSDEGATPLMLAAQKGRLNGVEFLLAHRADANAADLRGFTALHHAAERGFLEVVTALLDGGALPSPRAGPHTPLSVAQARGEAAVVDLLRRRVRRQPLGPV
ncbi:MAG: ankyrin repeat domain-containing protein [Deltaproteobacteria bacterium]